MPFDQKTLNMDRPWVFPLVGMVRQHKRSTSGERAQQICAPIAELVNRGNFSGMSCILAMWGSSSTWSDRIYTDIQDRRSHMQPQRQIYVNSWTIQDALKYVISYRTDDISERRAHKSRSWEGCIIIRQAHDAGLVAVVWLNGAVRSLMRNLNSRTRKGNYRAQTGWQPVLTHYAVSIASGSSGWHSKDQVPSKVKPANRRAYDAHIEKPCKKRIQAWSLINIWTRKCANVINSWAGIFRASIGGAGARIHCHLFQEVRKYWKSPESLVNRPR